MDEGSSRGDRAPKGTLREVFRILQRGQVMAQAHPFTLEQPHATVNFYANYQSKREADRAEQELLALGYKSTRSRETGLSINDSFSTAEISNLATNSTLFTNLIERGEQEMKAYKDK